MSAPRHQIFLASMVEELEAIGPNNETALYRRVRGAAQKRNASEQIVCTPASLLTWVRDKCSRGLCGSSELAQTQTPIEVRDKCSRGLCGSGIWEAWRWDLAATAANSVAGAENYFGPGSVHGEDALTADWGSVYAPRWCNPPFSRLAAFTKKARDEHLRGMSSVLLVRDSPGTKWWRDNVAGYARAHHIGRIWFVGHTQPSPFDLAVLTYDCCNKAPLADRFPTLTPAQRGRPEPLKGGTDD